MPAMLPLSLAAPAVLESARPTKILDFDLETVAAGFDDPQWVPQKITCVAWSWIGENPVESHICTPLGLFGDPSLRKDMLEALLAEISRADMLTGHNLERFDLPVLNAECMRLGLSAIRSVVVEDTMRLVRAKGFKRGQDNIVELFGLPRKKMALNWQEWQNAYDQDGWRTVRERCESDVLGHKEMRLKLLQYGYLRKPRKWIGYQ
jgi:DNA polymerase elongation subunit (family B)